MHFFLAGTRARRPPLRSGRLRAVALGQIRPAAAELPTPWRKKFITPLVRDAAECGFQFSIRKRSGHNVLEEVGFENVWHLAAISKNSFAQFAKINSIVKLRICISVLDSGKIRVCHTQRKQVVGLENFDRQSRI